MEHSKNDKQTQLFNILINLLHYITFLFHIKQSNLNEKQFIYYYIIFYIFYTFILFILYYIIKQYCIKTIYFPNVMTFSKYIYFALIFLISTTLLS